jgi:hypothetical protein
MNKKVNKAFILLVIIILFGMLLGCDDSSDSIDDSSNLSLLDDEQLKAIYSKPMTDIAGCYPYIWGLSTEAATDQGDYWIYYFNKNTNNWVKTQHWGAAVSVTPDGNCYHYNKYYNQIWYCTPGLQSYNIPLDPDMEGTIVDIASGYHQTAYTHSIWVIMAYQSMYDIYKYNDGAQAPGWHEIGYSGFWPRKVSCNPWSGDAGAFTSGGTEIKVFCDYGSGSGTWLTFDGPPAGHNPLDIAMPSIDVSEIITTDADGGLWITDVTGDTEALLPANSAYYYGLSGDHYFYYYLDTNKRVQRGSY